MSNKADTCRTYILLKNENLRLAEIFDDESQRFRDVAPR